jgi:hypothetical protein
LSEHGVVAAQGPANVKVLEEGIVDQMTSLPLLVVELARVFLDQIEGLSKPIAKLEKVTAHEATCAETARRLQTMPGVGPITALDGCPQTRTRFRRLARACPPATVDRWQTGSREDLKDGPARYSPPADHRRGDPRPR